MSAPKAPTKMSANMSATSSAGTRNGSSRAVWSPQGRAYAGIQCAGGRLGEIYACTRPLGRGPRRMPTFAASSTASIGSLGAKRDGAPFRQNSGRSEEHTSELQSLMRISYAVFCLKKKIYIILLYYIYLTY